MKTKAIGMIGCGEMGRVVTRMLLKQDPRIELRAVFDPARSSVRTTL